MYVIEFVKNKKVNIDYNVTYSIFDGLKRMREWNKEAKGNDDSFIMHYQIIDESTDEPVLVDKMYAGVEYNYNFFEVTRSRLTNLFEGQELEENLSLLERIEVQYEAEKDKYYANMTVEIQEEMASEPLEIEDNEDTEEKEPSKIKETIDKVKSNKKKRKKKTYESEENKQKDTVSIKEKIIAIYNNTEKKKLLVFSTVGLMTIIVVFITVALSNYSTQEEPEAFDNLIENHHFIEALEEYPHRYAEINNEIVNLGEQGLPFLEEFVSNRDEDFSAQLDLAYLNRDFDTLIELEEHANTDRRRYQLITALLHEKEYEQAAEIEGLIQNDSIQQEVTDSYLIHIQEYLTRGDIENAQELQNHANNVLINDYMAEFIELEGQIEEETAEGNNGLFNRSNEDSLREERSRLLSLKTLYDQEETAESSSLFTVLIVLLALLGFVSILFIFLKKNKPHAKITEFDEMMKNKLFIQALKQFPHKYPEIERNIFLLGEKGIPYLEEFISNKKGYKPGHFDLAFLKKDFEKVIKLEQYADTDGRKSQLAIAYIQLSEIDKANEINQYIEVPELASYLNEHYYQLTVEALRNDDMKLARKYQEKGNSSDIDYLIDTIKVIEDKIQSLIDGAKQLGLNSEEQSKMKKLEEAKAVCLNLD